MRSPDIQFHGTNPPPPLVKTNEEKDVLLAVGTGGVEFKQLKVVKGTASLESEDVKNKHRLKSMRAIEALIPEKCFVSILRTLQNMRSAGLPDLEPRLPKDSMISAASKQIRWYFGGGKSTSRSLKADYAVRSVRSPLRERLVDRSKLPMMKNSTKYEILQLVDENDVVIIVGATGSGKTTQVPQIILDHAIGRWRGTSCNIICTQPRRIATTSVAHRVAYERGEPLGQSVGYSIRFDHEQAASAGSITYSTTESCSGDFNPMQAKSWIDILISSSMKFTNELSRLTFCLQFFEEFLQIDD